MSLPKKIINVYIVEMWDDRITGFSTYKKQLMHCLKSVDNVELYLISLRCPTDQFVITTNQNGITLYQCPGRHLDVVELSGALLGFHIEDSKNNIFMFNFSPTAQWLKIFRKYFKNGNLVYVIHDFIWASFLLGDIDKFYNVLHNMPIDNHSTHIYRSYIDGIETFNIADKIVCLSDDTLNLLKDIYKISSKKISLIYNGLQSHIANSQYSKEENLRMFTHLNNPQVLLYVGRISMQKGALDLIDAFATVMKRFPNTVLVMAGEFNYSLLQYIPDNIRGQLLLLGCVSHEKLRKWYQIADWGVIPSYYEQCSYTGIEMKKFGLPIIASDGYGVKNMFTQKNSIIAAIKTNNNHRFSENLADTIIKALSLPKSEVLNYRFMSRKDFQERYEISKMYRKYINLLDNIIESKY